MRYILTPTLLITLVIVLAPLAPRIAEAQAQQVNFVTVFEDTIRGFCFSDRHPIGSLNSDAKEELQAGIEFAANNDRTNFRGIMRADKVADRGLQFCLAY